MAFRRAGTPQDVDERVAFPATVEPRYIAWQDIAIDGFQWNV